MGDAPYQLLGISLYQQDYVPAIFWSKVAHFALDQSHACSKKNKHQKNKQRPWKKTQQKSSQKQPFCFSLLRTHTPLHKAPPWAPQMFTSTRGIPSHMKFPRWRKTSRLAYEFLYCIKWRKAWKKNTVTNRWWFHPREERFLFRPRICWRLRFRGCWYSSVL